MRELLEAGRELGKLQTENEELKARVRELEREQDGATAHLELSKMAEQLRKAHADELDALRVEHQCAADAIGDLVKFERADLERTKAELVRVTNELESTKRALSKMAEQLRKAHADELDALERRVADLSELESEKARRIEFARESLEQLASMPAKLAEVRKLVKAVAVKLSASGSCD